MEYFESRRKDVLRTLGQSMVAKTEDDRRIGLQADLLFGIAKVGLTLLARSARRVGESGRAVPDPQWAEHSEYVLPAALDELDEGACEDAVSDACGVAHGIQPQIPEFILVEGKDDPYTFSDQLVRGSALQHLPVVCIPDVDPRHNHTRITPAQRLEELERAVL